MARQTFRANAAVLVGDGSGHVLGFRRASSVPRTDIWQCPQGGIDVGETPLEAALRELFEETAISQDEIEVIAEHPGWLAYEVPEPLRTRDRGQAQKWFLVRVAPGFEPNLAAARDREFDAWEWTTPKRLLRSVTPFKHDVYRRAFRYFTKHHKV